MNELIDILFLGSPLSIALNTRYSRVLDLDTMQNAEDVDMEVLYASIVEAFAKISNDDDTSFETCNTTLTRITTLVEHIRREAIFSTNEIIEDIATEHIKYIALDYFAGVVYNKIRTESDIVSEIASARTQNLQCAKNHLYAFIRRCVELGIVGQDEIKGLDNRKVQHTIYYIHLLL